jgi:aldose 1-epimerase
VTDDNDLVIEYSAKAADKKTVVSFTSHAFFNLSGSPGNTILDTELELAASKVLAIDANLVPTGVLRDVAGTPMDFRTPKRIGADIGVDYDLLKPGNGYDNAFVVDEHTNRVVPSGFEKLHFMAKAHEKTSGRSMEVWSTEPGVHLYSGNFLTGESPKDLGKGGVLFAFRSGFALEPSHFPDSVNHPTFPTTILNAGQTYSGKMVYRFYADAE